MTSTQELMLQAIPTPYMLLGLDLGQARDYTALSITERTYRLVGKPYNADVKDRRGEWIIEARQKVELEYRCRHLERLPLATAYPRQVKHVVKLTKRLGGNPVIVADQTGVGRPVVDLLIEELEKGIKDTDVRPTLVRVGITGGTVVTRIPGGVNVPKADLVSAPLVLMQNDRLLIAEDLKLKDTLVKELLNFKRKINVSTANTSFEAWRESDHDDLVLSLAMGAWAGQNLLHTLEYISAPGVIVQDGPLMFRGA